MSDVERRRDEAEGFGKGVDAEKPVDWPIGDRMSCSVCKGSAVARSYAKWEETLTFQSGPIIVAHNLSIS